MDVVASTVPGEEDIAWVYAVNHRPPEPAADADKVGADSVVEIFKTRIGGSVLDHVRTVRNERVVTPNDLVGRPDGKGFWVSNDHSTKVGLVSIPLNILGNPGDRPMFRPVPCAASLAALDQHWNHILPYRSGLQVCGRRHPCDQRSRSGSSWIPSRRTGYLLCGGLWSGRQDIRVGEAIG